LKGLATEAELTLLGNLYMEKGEAQLALFAYLDAIEKSPKLDIARALKSARILNDYGYPEKAAAFVEKVAKAPNLSSKDLLDLDLVRVSIAQSSGDAARTQTLLLDLFKRDPGNADVLLQLARHYDNLAKNEADEAKRSLPLREAKVHFKLALEKEAVAYQANLGMGQLLVREKQYTEGLPYIEKAVALKTGDKASLEQYLSRVRRAADRDGQRKEREAAAREEANPPAAAKPSSK